MALDTTLPPPLFDIDTGNLTPFLFEPAGHGVALTPYGRHHGLGPGVFGAPACDQALYASIESGARRVWIYHLCPIVGAHEQHKCDRCDEQWDLA